MKKLFTFLLFAIVSAQADTKAIHGMLLFGTKVLYASHLPMLHAPHDYQVIMKVALEAKANSDAYEKYKKLASTENTIFTLVPPPFDLTKLITGEITQLPATLFKGHFEKGGTKLGIVQLKVEKILKAVALNSPEIDHNQYFIFGESGEYFAAKEIVNSNAAFDFISKVSQPYELIFNHCRTRVCREPLKIFLKDALMPIGLEGTSDLPKVGDVLGDFNGVMADVTDVLHLENL